MNFNELAAARFSIRKFLENPVEKDKIDLVLEAARVAPTAANNQPQRILVIDRENELKKIDLCTKFRFSAPVVFMICYDDTVCWVRPLDNEKSGVIDASIVTTQMMLQAHDIGLGTTWIMGFDPFRLKEEFAIPPNITPVALLNLGYPVPGVKPYVTHNQKEPLEKTVFFNRFAD
jgi:nitroreductase